MPCLEKTKNESLISWHFCKNCKKKSKYVLQGGKRTWRAQRILSETFQMRGVGDWPGLHWESHSTRAAPGRGQTLTQVDCFDYIYCRNLLAMCPTPVCEKGTLRITPHSCPALNRTSIPPPPRPRKHCEGEGRRTEFLATACGTVIATMDKSSRGYLHKTGMAQKARKKGGQRL